MSVANAKQFLEEALKDPKLIEMLKGVSSKDLVQAAQDMQLDQISGGKRGSDPYRNDRKEY